MNLKLNLILYTKINSKWVKEMSMKPEITELTGRNFITSAFAVVSWV